MLDAVPSLKLQAVHPLLAAKVESLVVDFEAISAEGWYNALAGDTLVVAQALRTWADQEALWLKGRDGAGNVIAPGEVVTNAEPGYSWHEFGLAVDLVPKSLLTTPNWSPESDLWAVMTNAAERLGLVCGACWAHKDLPHVQLTGKFGVTPDASVRALYLGNGGKKAVWAASGLDAQ